MSDVIIGYDSEDYEILETKDINNNLVRTIKYSTGFYGLQMYVDSINNKAKTWKTIYVCPKKDIKEGMFELLQGQYYINCLVSYIEDSVRLHDGKYWELVVQTSSPEVFDSMREVIEKDDGKMLLNELFKSTKLQQKTMAKYATDDMYWRYLVIFNVLMYIILLLLWYFKI